MQDAFRAIASKCETRIFIETTVTKPQKTDPMVSFYRVEMIAKMIADENLPPNLVKAIATALPRSVVTALPDKGIQIIDRDINARLAAGYSNTNVKITQYTGSLRDLLKTIKVPSGTLSLDQVFTGTSSAEAVNMNFEITNFSFEGSVRELLDQIATQNGPTTSYIVTILEENTFVRFFAYTNKKADK